MARLLIVSADDGTRAQLAAWLAGAGRQIADERDAGSALLRVLSEEVTVAFVDLDSQEASGARAVELMRKARPGMPVVVLAKELSTGSVGRVRGAGVFFTMVKPLDRLEVEDVAASALRRASN